MKSENLTISPQRMKNIRGGILTWVIFLLLAVVVVVLVVFQSYRSYPRYGKTILLLCAAQSELKALLKTAKKNFKLIGEEIVAGRIFYRFKCEKSCTGTCDDNVCCFYLGRFGMSMLNAAGGTQAAIDAFQPDIVLFSGIAGSLNGDLLPIGSVFVPGLWVVYDNFKYLKRSLSHPGFFEDPIPNFPNPPILQMSGQNIASFTRPSCQDCDSSATSKTANSSGIFKFFGVSMKVEVLQAPRPETDTASFAANPQLLRGIDNTDVELIPFQSTPSTLKVLPASRGGSGSVFVVNDEYAQYLRQDLGIEVVDMESAGVGQVCACNNLPFAVIRSIVCILGDDAVAINDPEAVRVATMNMARVAMASIKEICRQVIPSMNQ